MIFFFFFFQAEDGIRDLTVTGVQTCALPISQAPAGSACISGSLARRPSVPRYADPAWGRQRPAGQACGRIRRRRQSRSEEHTSELQSQSNLVCRLLLEKKKKDNTVTRL